MTKKLLSVALVAAAALLWIRASSGQDVRPVPGFGTGIVTVTGTVDVSKPVKAAQEGEWKVAIAAPADVRVTNTPTVAVAAPDFLTAGRRYSVIWPSGSTEVIVVAQPGPGGWTRVETSAPSGRRRWVNLSGAQSVQELER